MKKSTKAGPKILTISAFAVIGITILVGLIYMGGAIVTYFSVTASRGEEYSAQFQVLEAAKKSFTSEETAEIGPYDVEVTSVQRGYVPTKADRAEVRKKLARHGSDLTEENGQYVLVKLHVMYNPARSGYDTLSVDNAGGWTGQLSRIWLNDTGVLLVTPSKLGGYGYSDHSYDIVRQELEVAKEADPGYDMALLYLIPKEADKLTLGCEIMFFTKVSPLVGTEGMPRKPYEYTISIQ